MPDERIDRGTAACEADTLPTALPLLVAAFEVSDYPPDIDDKSRVMRKPTFWFPTCSDTNQAVQLQKMARGLKFWI